MGYLRPLKQRHQRSNSTTTTAATSMHRQHEHQQRQHHAAETPTTVHMHTQHQKQETRHKTPETRNKKRQTAAPRVHHKYTTSTPQVHHKYTTAAFQHFPAIHLFDTVGIRLSLRDSMSLCEMNTFCENLSFSRSHKTLYNSCSLRCTATATQQHNRSGSTHVPTAAATTPVATTTS